MDPLSLYDAGYAEGFEKGYKVGFAEGKEGIDTDASNLDTRITALWGEIQTLTARIDYLTTVLGEKENGK